MDFGLKIINEMPVYFIGVDLGQAQDHSALAVVERSDVLLGMNYVTYERERARRYRVVQLERVTLGTPYPDVVERVRRVTRQRSLAGKCTIVMDATGVGAPVLDQMRQSGLRCPIEAVILTGGDRETQGVDGFNVPKHDLVTGLRVRW